jgi:hypothetical protein
VRGKPHAAFDEAGAGNAAWSRWCDTRRRKSEPTGNTNFDLNRRASPRPYLWGRRRATAASTRPLDYCSLAEAPKVAGRWLRSYWTVASDETS